MRDVHDIEEEIKRKKMRRPSRKSEDPQERYGLKSLHENTYDTIYK